MARSTRYNQFNAKEEFEDLLFTKYFIELKSFHLMLKGLNGDVAKYYFFAKSTFE